jgi:hypothetical protein
MHFDQPRGMPRARTRRRSYQRACMEPYRTCVDRERREPRRDAQLPQQVPPPAAFTSSALVRADVLVTAGRPSRMPVLAVAQPPRTPPERHRRPPQEWVPRDGRWSVARGDHPPPPRVSARRSTAHLFLADERPETRTGSRTRTRAPRERASYIVTRFGGKKSTARRERRVGAIRLPSAPASRYREHHQW